MKRVFDVAVYWKYLHCKKVVEIFERESGVSAKDINAIQVWFKTLDGVYMLRDCNWFVSENLSENHKLCMESLSDELFEAALPLIHGKLCRLCFIRIPKEDSNFSFTQNASVRYKIGNCKSPVSHIYPPNIPKDTVKECISVLWDALDHLVGVVRTPEVGRLAGMLTNLCVENNGTDSYALRVEMLGMMPGNRARRSSILVSFKLSKEGKDAAALELSDKLRNEYLRISSEEKFLKDLKDVKSVSPFSYKTIEEWVNVVRSAKIVELTLGREYIDLSLLKPERVSGCMYAYNALSEMERLKVDVMCGLVKKFPGCSLNKAFRNEVLKKLSAYSEYIRKGKAG